ncbi:beta-lactamase regulating signal transducer with metallopeptidase domain [Natranaerovirga pectinivora]|uniref:Beta-lactamase regulating signal transducer with metallopeptidase domain n=1 Tax=Natranaerovirga pectinivora TaxID=682400 RepID=A0A4R3MPA6_9FIRM|nr:M56 family metallopeptidase [Natranaerovirga pectinivora]TCT15429.1 beta-lactamase regulating signal transducer with metallopeptidase domain [Natranaerovirga pectinivora]
MVNILNNIFNLVITTSLYATVVGIVIILSKTILKDKLSGRWHYFLWAILIFKIIIPYGPESQLSIFNHLNWPNIENSINITLLDNEKVQQRNPIQITNLENSIQNNSTVDLLQEHNKSDDILKEPIVFNNINNTYDGGTDVYYVPDAKSIFIFIWLLGVFSFILWIIYTYFALHKKISMGYVLEDDRVNVILEHCKKKVRIKKNINIFIQDVVNTPSLFGVFKPRILLKLDVLTLSDKEIEYIFLHELAHYKRKDLLVNYILLILQSLHWFNPIIWHCFKLIRQDMEIATDDNVIDVLTNNEYRDYGKTLLVVLEKFSMDKFIPNVVGVVDNRRSIKRRIKMIKASEISKRKKGLCFIVGIICITLLGSVLLTSPISSFSVDKERNWSLDIEQIMEFVDSNNYDLVALVESLYYGENVQSLEVNEESIRIDYYFEENIELDIINIKETLKKNATILYAFPLIKNQEVIFFNILTNDEDIALNYHVEDIAQDFDIQLSEYLKSEDTLKELLKLMNEDFIINYHSNYPLEYQTGIVLSSQYNGELDRVIYSTDYGFFSIIDNHTEKANFIGKKAEVSTDTILCWKPYNDENIIIEEQKVKINVSILDSDNVVFKEREFYIYISDSQVKLSKMPFIKSSPIYPSVEVYDSLLDMERKSPSRVFLAEEKISIVDGLIENATKLDPNVFMVERPSYYFKINDVNGESITVILWKDIVGALVFENSNEPVHYVTYNDIKKLNSILYSSTN